MTNLRSVLLIAVALVLGMIAVTHAQETMNQGKSMSNETLPRPKVIIFDVNETLLDLAPLKTSVGKALDGREDLLR